MGFTKTVNGHLQHIDDDSLSELTNEKGNQNLRRKVLEGTTVCCRYED